MYINCREHVYVYKLLRRDYQENNLKISPFNSISIYPMA